MKMKSFTRKAIAMALLSGAAVSANAAVYNLGASIVGVPLSFNALATPGVFNDIFNFTLPANGGSGYSVISFDVSPFFVTQLAAVALVSNADGIIGSPDDDIKGSALAGDVKSLGFAVGSLPAGSYFLFVSGITSGDVGGLYNGAISVSAVPEPESYALFLAGLGIMGVIARRRSKAPTV